MFETNATNLTLNLESTVEEKSMTQSYQNQFKSSKAKSESKHLLRARLE